MTTIEDVALLLAIAKAGFIFGYFACLLRKAYAVRGTHERYRASTFKVMFAAGAMITTAGTSALHSLEGDYSGSTWDAFLFLLWLSMLILELNDDNWFNRQGGRMKRWFKKARSLRIRFRLPLPGLATN